MSNYQWHYTLFIPPLLPPPRMEAGVDALFCWATEKCETAMGEETLYK